jgi:hypothetical protein
MVPRYSILMNTKRGSRTIINNEYLHGIKHAGWKVSHWDTVQTPMKVFVAKNKIKTERRGKKLAFAKVV